MKPIPKPITVTTGEQEKVTNTIDDFFKDTLDFLKEKYCIEGSPGFEIKSGELAYHSLQITDDRITYLKYKENILASVFETRTENNFVKYTFFRNLEGFTK